MKDHSEIVVVIFDSNSETLRTYDVATHQWDRMQTYTGEMSKRNFSGALLNEDIYVFLSNKSVYKLQYTFTRPSWQQLPSMLMDHGQHPSVAVLNGFIYVIGTGGAGFESRSCERFNAAWSGWEMITDMQQERRNHVTVACANSIFSIGGQTSEGELGSVERYNTHTLTWMNTAPLLTPRHSGAAAEIHEKIYVVGGWTRGERLNSVEMYDPIGNTWTRVQSMMVPRTRLQACVVGGRILAIGGDESRRETMEIFDRHTSKWKILSDLDAIKIDAAIAVP